MPALTLDFGSAVACFVGRTVASEGTDCETASLYSGLRAGEGVKGVENGWAAEVDVAAGGLAGDGRRVVVEKKRSEDMGWRRERQRWQIMFCGNCRVCGVKLDRE